MDIITLRGCVHCMLWRACFGGPNNKNNGKKDEREEVTKTASKSKARTSVSDPCEHRETKKKKVAGMDVPTADGGRQSTRKRRKPTSDENEQDEAPRRSVRRRTSSPAIQNDNENEAVMQDASEVEDAEVEDVDEDEDVDSEMDDIASESEDENENNNGHHLENGIAVAGNNNVAFAADSLPVNGTTTDAAASRASAGTTARRNPLSKLRMPSQHTPGKNKGVERPTSSLSDAPEFSRRLIFQQQASASGTPEPTTDVQVETVEENDEEEEDRHLHESHHADSGIEGDSEVNNEDSVKGKLTKILSAITSGFGGAMKRFGGTKGTVAWIFYLFLIQIILSQLHIYSSWKSVGKGSKTALVFYQSLLHKSTQEQVALVQEIPEQGSDVGAPQVVQREIPTEIVEGLQGLEGLKTRLTSSLSTILMESEGLSSAATMIGELMSTKEGELHDLDARLSEAQTLLVTALEYGDLSSEAWQAARVASSNIGRTVLDGTSLELWQVDDPILCPETQVVAKKPDPKKALLSVEALLSHVGFLRTTADKSARRVIDSPESAEKAREWVKAQIDTTLSGDTDAARALSELSTSTPVGMTVEEVNEAIEKRLEMDRADKTGQIDHASVLNGARVIHGGKRGTTKSLVDTLPILNRWMQKMTLRFYGHGPEAALTPTYPPDALGQCWAFVQTPVSDQIKRRKLYMEDDIHVDHKRGNFGTLTVSLPYPVLVKSIVIEHPPKSLTDQITSAIRSFRIIGYTDSMAAGKSWSLGSFEFDINGDPMQEFLVNTDSFGAYIPRLHSISLAVDSNWGFDYACLYRLRVHGEKYTSRY